MHIPPSTFKKLKDWTPSSKIQEYLGLSKEDYSETSFKAYLKSLAETTFLLKEGERKGLKYKLNPNWKKPESDSEEETLEEEASLEEEPVVEEAQEAQEDIETYIKNRDSVSKSLKAKNSLIEVMLWLTTNTPAVSTASISIGFRKTSDGLVTVTLYNGLNTLRTKQFASDSFEELLKKSLNSDNVPTLI